MFRALERVITDAQHRGVGDNCGVQKIKEVERDIEEVNEMKRLLLVVDEAVADAELLPADVRERLEQFDEIRVVVPALNSRLSSWASDATARLPKPRRGFYA